METTTMTMMMTTTMTWTWTTNGSHSPMFSNVEDQTNNCHEETFGWTSLPLVDVVVHFAFDVFSPQLRDVSLLVLPQRSDHPNKWSDEHCEEDDQDLSSCSPSFSTIE